MPGHEVVHINLQTLDVVRLEVAHQLKVGVVDNWRVTEDVVEVLVDVAEVQSQESEFVLVRLI